MHKIKILGHCIRSSILALVVAVLTLGASASSASAADVPDYRLQISPSQTDLGELKPGETYEGSFKIQNTGLKELPYKVSISPYSVTGADYEPDFNKTSGYTEIADWITLSETVGTVQPNDMATISYKISVPDDAPGGNQNAAIIVALDQDKIDDNSIIQTSQRIAHFLYSNVSGQTREEAKVTTNKVPSFVFAPPVTVTSTIENTGNVYAKASYTLEVKSFFGGKEVYSNSEEPDTKIIFPDTERYNEVSWEGAPQIGLFKVKQTVKIFDEVSEVEKVVFLCPLWFLILIIAIIGVIIFWIVSRILKRKSA